MLTWLSIAAGAVVFFLSRDLLRRRGADRIQALLDKRGPNALVATRGGFVDGARHIDVAMALTPQTLFYENAHMEASLDLQWVSEVEYDSRVRTGANVEDGQVLRLRCYSRCFEFIVPAHALARWQEMLPSRGGAPLPVENTVPRFAGAI